MVLSEDGMSDGTRGPEIKKVRDSKANKQPKKTKCQTRSLRSQEERRIMLEKDGSSAFYVRNTMKFPLNPTAAALLELYTATGPFTVDAAAPRCTKKKQAITAGIRLSVMLHKCTFHFTAVWSVKMLQEIR
jgi:hypothetical protein